MGPEGYDVTTGRRVSASPPWRKRMRSAVATWQPVSTRHAAGKVMIVAFDEVLADRLRERLHGRDGVTEKKMFGGLAFLTHGNMTVGVHQDDLIVRLDPAATGEALSGPGVRPFDVTGRPMRGWLLVGGEHLDDEQLDRWLAEAGAFVATLPPK
jgi:TfoX/Sxy family transcriptional regulator of competence genes